MDVNFFTGFILYVYKELFKRHLPWIVTGESFLLNIYHEFPTARAPQIQLIPPCEFVTGG